MLFKVEIEDIDDIDWEYFWKKKIKEKSDKGARKNWDKAAPKYAKLNQKDNYTERLFDNLILDNEDSLLDIGSGEGSVSIPLSKKVKKVTAVDSSEKMLELLNKKSDEQGISNIETINMDITDVNVDNIGHHDIVLASRSINFIKEMEELLYNLNDVANKYVFITLFGPNNWRMEKEFFKYMNREYIENPSYIIILNLLKEMGIYANVLNLDVGPIRTYKDIDEAMVNGKWKLDNFTLDEQDQLREFLKTSLKVDPQTGKLTNPLDKPDWVLIWWKKVEDL
ncbi:MAG: class I SAM-dependent methyltransferase [Methanobacteriaceae archaeon]|jgi:ubiquinone/menaquinone biosynthesis C-methylase UbiE|nr:class I SAM-dependent methyltransferase [Methanobacteriaceae archaeon]